MSEVDNSELLGGDNTYGFDDSGSNGSFMEPDLTQEPQSHQESAVSQLDGSQMQQPEDDEVGECTSWPYDQDN